MAEFSPDITVANDYTLLSADTKYGCMELTGEPVKVELGVIKRTTLYIQNVSDSGAVYIGFDDSVTNQHFAVKLYPKIPLQFSLDRENPTEVWVYGSGMISIAEGK